MNYIKHKALHFIKETNISKIPITPQALRTAAQRKGYIIKGYSTSATLMIVLGIYDEAKKAASVSTIDADKNILIFIDDLMPRDKQLFALAHEIGHIELSHTLRTPGSIQENEANRFAHYLLFFNRVRFPISKALIPLIAVLCVIAILLSSVLLKSCEAITTASPGSSSLLQERYLNDTHIAQTYYWTESGRVYHLYYDCQSLKNSKAILSGSFAEACKAKERLCKFCDKRK